MPRVSHLLDNITWDALTGPQAHFASGAGDVRRYATGFSPIIGFADPRRPDFTTLARYCTPGEQLYSDGWAGPVPDGWQLALESTMFKMIWTSSDPISDEAPEAVRLNASHAEQALQLATLTRPGPFGPRTLELGEYFGYFDDTRLVAMAGERMYAGQFREISGVCTHPDFQGRGLARRLMTKLIHREVQRSEVPFLHVVRSNAVAHQMYNRMGFDYYWESVVRVVSLKS